MAKELKFLVSLASLINLHPAELRAKIEALCTTHSFYTEK